MPASDQAPDGEWFAKDVVAIRAHLRHELREQAQLLLAAAASCTDSSLQRKLIEMGANWLQAADARESR